MCQHTDPGMTRKHRDLIHSGRVATVEYHGLLVDVELGRESLYLVLDGVPCIFIHLLEVACSCTHVHVGALL